MKKQVIPILLLLVLLAGCATSGKRPHPYDRDSNQLKCKICGQWYDGTPINAEAKEEGGDATPKGTCPECGRALPEEKKSDWSGVNDAFFLAEVIIYGGIALIFAGILGLAFA